MKCKACGLEHPALMRCEVAKARAGSSTVECLPVEQEVVGSTPIQPAIKQAQEFIKKVGRPRIYPDAKVRRKQYMKAWRARKK